jgi:hypothetical protein
MKRATARTHVAITESQMLYAKDDSRYPSVVVTDGQTLTLSGAARRVSGVPALVVRPRTTAALLLVGGRRPPLLPRLSDESQFEEMDCSDGLVDLGEPDREGRIDGYSRAFLRGIFDRLDPDQRTPAERVRAVIPPPEREVACRCPARATTEGVAVDVTALDDVALRKLGYTVREWFVPEFIQRLSVFRYINRLGDIIVGRNSTLVLEADFGFAIADNFLAYHGARIVQQAANVTLDIVGRMRGSVSITAHDIVGQTVKLDPGLLAKDIVTKP